ncbi:MAG: VanZ family protein [Actinomycetota bacterium]
MLRRLAMLLVLLIYLGGVAISVFGPAPDEVLGEGAEKGRRIEAIARAAARGDRAGATSTSAPVRDVFPGLDAEDVGNIAMFVPLGLLFPVAMPRWRRWAIPLGVTLSACIELTQGLFLSWRTPSLADIGWNSLGAALGFAAWYLLRGVARVVSPPHRAQV